MFQCECSRPQGKRAPSAFHRHPPGFCNVHFSENKIAFYEAVPFLFPPSGRFAENNLNFMQLPLRGSAAPFPSHKQVWLWRRVLVLLLSSKPLPLGP